MKTPWPEVPIGEFLTPARETVRIASGTEYKQITVSMHGRGVRLRQIVLGAEMRTKLQYRARAGRFIYSRIDARNGAMGIVPDELNGAVISGDFPTFAFEPAKVEPRFFEYVTKTASFEEMCLTPSRGVTNRKRLKEAELLSFRVPLPPLPEQRRIVAKIDQIAARVQEAKRLREKLEDERNAFLAQMANRFDLSDKQKRAQGWRQKPLADVLFPYVESHNVKPHGHYPNIGVFSFGRGIFQKPPIKGAETKAKTLYRVKAGQFIYSRLFAFEGAYGFVTPEADGAFVSGEFPAFDCKPGELIAEFLFCYFKSPDRWRQLRENCKGLGGRRQRLKAEYLLPHKIMLPPPDYQLATKNALESFNKESQTRVDIQAELEALMPALLDQAFRGEI